MLQRDLATAGVCNRDLRVAVVHVRTGDSILLVHSELAAVCSTAAAPLFPSVGLTDCSDRLASTTDRMQERQRETIPAPPRYLSSASCRALTAAIDNTAPQPQATLPQRGSRLQSRRRETQ